MSREGGPAGGGGRDGASGVAAQPFPPQFYPVVGYQGSPQAWFPPHPSTGVPATWSPSWRPPMGYPAPTPPWAAQQAPSTSIASTAKGTGASDEYTVDTLRRVFKDDDGRVEIQRVKVQRRNPEPGAVTVASPEAMSVVPVGTFPLNERRPPPRRNRRKPEIHVTAMGPAGPYPWYPYMPYMPYPYPYPYYFPGGCVWPSGATSDTFSTWSGNDESEGASSHQDSALNSQRLESRVSHLSRDSFPSHRSTSPAAASHITDTHSIAPSDSVSVRGRKRETSLERALLGPTPPPRTKSRASSSLGCKSDAGKTQEWMLEMQRALRASGDVSVKAPATGSLRDVSSDVIYKKIPPIRKRRKMKADDMSSKSSITDLKDIDDLSERQSAVSDVAFDDSRLSPELNYAFRKLERSVEAFRHEINADSPVQSHAESPSVEISQSSGEVTPTEAFGSPFSDIRSLAEKAKEEETKRPGSSKRSRAISESVSSLPSLEAARTGSAPDVSHHHRLPIVSPSQSKESTVTNIITVTSTAVCSSSPTTTASTAQATPSSVTAQRKGDDKVPSASSESTTVTLKGEAVSEATPKPSSSEESSEASNTTLIFRPSSVPQSSQGLSAATTTATTTEAKTLPAETGTSKAATATETAVTVKERSVEVSSEANTGLEGVGEASGRQSQASSATTFFSTRTTDDSHAVDTDSTDIPMPTTADENEESPASTGPEDDHPWVLQRPEEAPTLNTAGQDERRNAWRAEVSLWRARLVVSLCRGRGLDRQDWATFHLMVHHPLTLDLKLSLLHAPRLCTANSSVGPAVLRVALIQLAQYGETLLQSESARQSGWRSIRLDAGHAWVPVKGAAEILQSLGYQERGDGAELRYSRRCSPEASVVARLTLDMLVLAEEFRLFLTGTHQYPTNVSDLFYPESVAMSAVTDLPQRPPSSEGSFISAQSEAGPVTIGESRASSVTDEDTETLQTCALAVGNHEKLLRHKSTSEEDITVKEDDIKKEPVEITSAEIGEVKQEPAPKVVTRTDSEASAEGPDGQQLLTPASDSTSLSSDVTSLPDLQSNTTSGDSQRLDGSEVSSGNETVTPGASPTPTPEVNSVSKADEANHATSATPTPAATNDNPEEHVYEEIDVIRAQVQAIRASSVPADSAPPPLPPKKKVSSGGEDDSGLSLTYPQVEWSSASTPGSLRGGSTSAKRKKRRAPMPPEFMPPDWKQRQDPPKKDDLEPTVKIRESKDPDNTKKNEYRRSLNPFYEEIDAVQDEVREMESKKATDQEESAASGNPFLEDKPKAAGYVGKNPFYDDVVLLKKSEEYKEIKRNEPSPAAPKDESASPPTPAEQAEPPVVRPKRRAPRPPPTPPAPADEPQKPATQQHTPATPSPANTRKTKAQDEQKVSATELQVNERREKEKVSGGDGVKQPSKPTPQKSDEIAAKSSVSANEENSKTTEETSSVPPPLPPPNQRIADADTPPTLTPKMNRVIRVSPSHPRAPPPPPPTQAKSTTPAPEEKAKTPKEETPPPIPPPKAPLSLLDEIPYMDASELKEAKEKESSESDLVAPGAVMTTPTLPRQPALVLTTVGLPPECPPPPPPCPPPESPPETPHNSPPDTPHVSPPETPHTSPPATPHASPKPSPKPSPIPLSRHQTQHSLVTTEKGSVDHVSATDKEDGTAPPVPPKIIQEEGTPPVPRRTPQEEGTTPPVPRKTTEQEGTPPPVPPKNLTPEGTPPVPPKNIHPEGTPPVSPKNLHPDTASQPQNGSSATHGPVTAKHSGQSSSSEERYEIPDTSRAPPPRPQIQTLPTAKQTNGKTGPPQEEDRYEVPEDPKQPIGVSSKGGSERVKAIEAEERYEIPQVVKETSVKRGVNGATSVSGKSSCILL
ncbi:mucin-17-like isoform X2 [Eriocheir sinensis]|uniref:mucin-17-like isoform X2 n=1 Tax=Eriocheir sinensis TaxID=95602 RepID=UPI0021C8A1BB|nr:mucin-17-like isoform X2 [Eriocheir sinensis]